MAVKTIPNLSPAFIRKGKKDIGVILSPKEYRKIQELLEDLEDIIDFKKGRKEKFTSFEKFAESLHANR